MTKATLGLVFLFVAILNIYWASKIYDLKRKNGSKIEMEFFESESRKLSKWSRVSYLFAACLLVLFVIFNKGLK
jgi:hypothetical protein